MRNEFQALLDAAMAENDATEVSPPPPSFDPCLQRWQELQAVPACLRTLGLLRSCNVAEVKRAFRREALRAHPDQGGSVSAFIAVQSAYRAALACVSPPALP